MKANMRADMRAMVERERVMGWPLLLSWIAIYGGSWAIAFAIYFLASRVLGS